MKKLTIVILIFILLTSCKFTRTEETRGEKTTVPNLILENARYVIGQQEEKPIVVIAENVTFYSKDNLAVLENFSFTQTDDDTIVLSGRAGYCELNTKTNVMNLKNDIEINQLKQEMSIKADSLYFDTAQEEISTEGYVMVESKSGNFTGYGFNGDLINQTFSFNRLDQGDIEL